MYLNGIGTATPSARYSKLDCWDALRRSDWFERLSGRTRALARAVLLGENGMEARWLAVDSLAEVFRIDPDTLHRRFLKTAPELAARAGAAALDNAQLAAGDVDAVVVSTCTGYLCPGLTGYVIERLGLRPNTRGVRSRWTGLRSSAAQHAPQPFPVTPLPELRERLSQRSLDLCRGLECGHVPR